MAKQFGSGSYRYEWVEGWGDIPSEWKQGQVAGLGIDQKDHIYILTRTKPTIIVLNPDGSLVDTWDSDYIERPHDLLYDPQEGFFIVDDAGHAVYQYNEKKELVRTIGHKGVPSDTGAEGRKYKTIKQVAGPFNYPTGVAISPDRKLYVTDGYGNARVHCFSMKGELLFGWGDVGTEPGHFQLPHGLIFYHGLLYVADRENNRLQVFREDGSFVKILDRDFVRPAQMAIGPDDNLYVAECKRCNNYEGGASRVTILDPDGEVITRLDVEGEYDETLPYHTAHGITIDSEGSIYVGEVGKVKPGYWGMQKFVRI